jgi:hypothetical protein
MKTLNRSLVAAVIAALVVSPAFAQTGAQKGTTQTKTAPPKAAKATTQAKQQAPKTLRWVGNLKTTDRSGSFSFLCKRKTYTVEDGKAAVTMNKKPFMIDKVTVGSLVAITGTVKGTDISAKKIVVERIGPPKKKSPQPSKPATPTKPVKPHIGN